MSKPNFVAADPTFGFFYGRSLVGIWATGHAEKGGAMHMFGFMASRCPAGRRSKTYFGGVGRRPATAAPRT